jgi:cobalt-zinc-cadmium efflux system membrane fusion protein
MKIISMKNILLGGFFIQSLFLMQACTDGNTAENKQPDLFCLTDTLMRQLTIDTVKNQTVMNELKLSGKVTYNEDKVVKVYPLVGGNVEDLKVELGDYVQKGQILAVIRSSEIANFENQLITAQSNLIVAQKNLSVAEDMFESGLNSERDLVMARKELQNSESELTRIQEVLHIYGVGKKSLYTVKAPISGFIIEKNVTENMQFRSDNTDNLFTISNVDEVWTVANVFESDINKVKLGYEAEITTISYPDQVFKGKVDKIFNALDPQSRVMKIRIRMQNKDFKLKPEMFANVTIRYNEDKQMLEIPADDVIFDKNKYFVMLYKSKCDIETREVKPYKIVAGRAYIDSGLQAGENVLSRNKLLVYDALND